MADHKSKFDKRPEFNYSWVILIVVLGLVLFSMLPTTPSGAKIKETKDLRLFIEQGDVQNIEIVRNKNLARIYIKPDRIKEQRHFSIQKSKTDKYPFLFNKAKDKFYTYDYSSSIQFNNDITSFQQNLPENQKILPNVIDDNSFNFTDLLGWLPFIAMILITIFIFKRMSGGGMGGAGGGIFNVGKSKANIIEKGDISTTFNDVAGLDEAKQEIEEIVDFLKNPGKYTDLGGKIPKGALLVGPPGTGKTLLAKAVAGEANVPFFSLSVSDFVEMFVGVGAARVRDLFTQAKEKAPCIIFIDEIDAIGRARGKNPMQGSNDERENTLNQLLTEMDGFGTNKGVIVLAATNRADILDNALLRPGRFDRQIQIDLPQLKGRIAIFKVHTKSIKIDNSIDLEFLAKQTPGFSGADIANLCNEAALLAARNDNKVIVKQDFLNAIDRVVGGLENRTKIYPPKTRETIAVHEAGHALVSWFLEHAHQFVKVTIVPRGRAEGYAQYLPEENRLSTTEHIKHEMCVTLGGRAAEEIAIGAISSGAWDDLRKVTASAYRMVKSLGMSSKLPNVNYDELESNSYIGKPYSEHTAQIIDEEVGHIIAELYEKAKEIIHIHREKLDIIAAQLLEKEVLFREDMEAICGKRPYDDHNLNIA